jgi:hypothetical protein
MEAQREVSERSKRERRRLMDKQNLEERRPTHIALGLQSLYHLLEGHFLVGIGIQRYLLEPG